MRAIVLEKFGGPDSLIIKEQTLISRRALDLAPASVFETCQSPWRSYCERYRATHW